MIAVLFKESLAKIGVNLTLRPLASGQFMTAKLEHSLDFLVFNYQGWVHTGLYNIGRYFTTGAHTNYIGYKNELLDELYSQAVVEMDDSTRLELVRQMQDIAVEDAVLIYVAQPDFQRAMRTDIGGYVTEGTLIDHLWMLYRVDEDGLVIP